MHAQRRLWRRRGSSTWRPASAINIVRLANWLEERLRAKTRYGAFERLYRQVA